MSDPGRPFADQVALVTGGGSGIGRAVCLALARGAASVVAADRDAARAEETRALLEPIAGQDRCLGVQADVTREEDADAMARAALERFGRLDILVACAGILRASGSSPKPLAQLTPREWDEVIAVNLRGTFLSNRAVLGEMIRKRRGQIVNVSSTSGRKGQALDAPYSASKFGIIGLTESLAEEVRHHNIRVQVILPDVVATALWDQNGPFGAPPDALPAERVADLIAYMLALPADTMVQGLTVAPFRGRRRAGPKTTQS